MFPVLGDIKAGGVQFFKPTQNIDKMSVVYNTYQDVPDFNPSYLGRMSPNHIHVVDSYCLHKTMQGGMRVSVDWRFVVNNEWLEPGDVHGIGMAMRRKGNFVPLWDLEGRN